MNRATEAGTGGELEHLDEVVGGEAGLVAGHREADNVRMGVLGAVPGDAQCLLDPEVAHGRDQDPPLDAGVAAGVVDPARDPVPMFLVAQPDERGVVGGSRQLDVDSAPAGTRAQVFVRDVSIVLASAHHARGEIVGAQEIEEVRVAEAPVGAEQPLRQLDAVARRDVAHELGRSGALQMDVQLGFGESLHGR